MNSKKAGGFVMVRNDKLETEQISGTVENIVCYKPESGFVVFDLDMKGELVTVVGDKLTPFLFAFLPISLSGVEDRERRDYKSVVQGSIWLA